MLNIVREIMREDLRSNIQRAYVTATNLDYVGSVSIDGSNHVQIFHSPLLPSFRPVTGDITGDA